MLDYKPNMVLSNEEFKVVGSRPVRHDGVDKVTAAPAMPPIPRCPACSTRKCFAARTPMLASAESTQAAR